jgi:Shikimate kinase
MTPRLEPVYPDDYVFEACLQWLAEDRFSILALDGRDGAGKTTLGHYLALHSGRQFLDTDFYLKRSKLAAPTHTKDLARVLNRQKGRNRPIVLAGVFIAETLKKMSISIDLLVRVIRVEQSGNDGWGDDYNSYEAAYNPVHKVYLPCLGAERPDKKCFMLGKVPVVGRHGVGPCMWCEAQSQTAQRKDCPWWD